MKIVPSEQTFPPVSVTFAINYSKQLFSSSSLVLFKEEPICTVLGVTDRSENSESIERLMERTERMIIIK